MAGSVRLGLARTLGRMGAEKRTARGIQAAFDRGHGLG